MRNLLGALAALSPALGMAMPADSAAAGPGAPDTFVYLVQDDGKELKAPLFAKASADLHVARVGDEFITVQELASALAGAHQAVGAEAKAGKKDFAPILDRMIEVRLLLQEAEAMGIAEMPEFEQAMKDFAEVTKREHLQRHVLKGVKPDPKEVERLYREATKEWQLRSVLFAKESEAKALRPVLADAKSFEDAAKQLVAQGKARGGGDPAFFPREQMLPPVLATVEKLKVGAVSEPIRVGEGFAVVKLEGTRSREDAKARTEAEAQALGLAKKKALDSYYAGLLKKYVKTDQALLKKLDFEAPKPGFVALSKDKRVLSRVQGGKDVTVGDLTAELASAFYHSVEGAIREKKVNRSKAIALDALLSKQLVPMEAERLGITRSLEYRAALAEYRRSVLFNQFVAKAVLPGVQVKDEDVEKAYQQRKSEFMYPGFYKLESIGFEKLADAEAALKKLQSGTELRWLRSNAEGQVKDTEADVQFNGSTVAASAMPKDLRTLLNGTKKGDWRLYASERKQSHCIHVLEVTAPEPKPFDLVKDQLKQDLTNERIQASVNDWAAKVRQARTVKVYLTKIAT